MLTNEQKAKKLETIKNLLAKSSDASCPLVEQCLFREKAHELMTKYVIDIAECAELASETPIIEKDLVLAPDIWVDRNMFTLMPHLLEPIASFFGCGSLVRITDKSRTELIIGFAPNVEMTEYAMNVVLRQGILEYRKLYKLNPTISFGASFWEGFALGIAKKFEAPANTETGIVLYDKVKAHTQAQITGMYAAHVYGSQDERKAGIAVGENITLHKPIETTKKGNLLG